MSSPVSRSVWRKASTIEPSVGCEVLPDSASIAPSTASTPAVAAAMIVAIAAPEVSWVWKWTGIVSSSFSARTSTLAAAGFKSPAMSFSPRTCAPAASSSRAMLT